MAFNMNLVNILFLLLFFLSSSNAKPNYFTVNLKNINGPISRNYTYACNPMRFSDLGLNMNDYAYCNSKLSYVDRVKDLIGRMTLEEKVNQIGDTALGVDRIGLPRYEWWSEALHGVSNITQTNSTSAYFDNVVPGATSFPTPILTTAAFNETLWKSIGQAVSTEARAMHNLNHAGLTFWSPNINVVRDPRWGRALETPGEDPFVAGIYAANYVRGLQDVEGTQNSTDLNTRPLKVAACCKHYAAYDVDNWKGVDRLHFDARVTEPDMSETFLRPFEMCVKEGDVSSVMCSYNRVNGIPTCADTKLLGNTVRGKWNLHGYIVSDCDSVEVMVDDHKWLGDTPEDAVSQTLKAGLDLDCGDFYPKFGANAVGMGKVQEADIENALQNLYLVLMRLGFFDGSPKFEKLGKKDICSPDHINLALEAARQGIVLLQNTNGTLPLNPAQFGTIALVGPHVNATTVMIGNYAGVPCRYMSPYNAFGLMRSAGVLKDVLLAEGCDGVTCNSDSLIAQATQAAQKSDATVIIAGLNLSIEAEGLDRNDLLLPGFQTQLINQVAAAAKGPVILVIMSGGCVDISFAKNNTNIKAILWAGYPGEEGGQAIADVIFGKYSPGGKLPITWYENGYVDQLPMTSMSLRPNGSYPGRTYKFFNGPTVYQFGFGLSYASFGYKVDDPRISLNVKLNKFDYCRDLNYTNGVAKPTCPAVSLDDIQACDKQNIQFTVSLQNLGTIDGSEVVMVYWSAPKGIVVAPRKQLVAFKKVFVAAGQATQVNFNLNACKDLGLVDYTGYTVLAAGSHLFSLGEASFFPVNVTFMA